MKRISNFHFAARARILSISSSPEEKLNAILREEWVKDSPDPVPELAEEFQVSGNFMRKRLELKLINPTTCIRQYK